MSGLPSSFSHLPSSQLRKKKLKSWFSSHHPPPTITTPRHVRSDTPDGLPTSSIVPPLSSMPGASKNVWLPHNLVFDRRAVDILYNIHEPTDDPDFFRQLLRNLPAEDLQHLLIPWLSCGESELVVQYLPSQLFAQRALARLLTSNDVKDLWHENNDRYLPLPGFEKSPKTTLLRDFKEQLLQSTPEEFDMILQNVSTNRDPKYANLASRARTILNTRSADIAIAKAVEGLDAATNILRHIQPGLVTLPMLLPVKQQVREFRHNHACYSGCSLGQSWPEIEAYLDDVKTFAKTLGLEESQAKLEATEALIEHTTIRDWLGKSGHGNVIRNVFFTKSSSPLFSEHRSSIKRKRRDSSSGSPEPTINATGTITSKRSKLSRQPSRTLATPVIQSSAIESDLTEEIVRVNASVTKRPSLDLGDLCNHGPMDDADIGIIHKTIEIPNSEVDLAAATKDKDEFHSEDQDTKPLERSKSRSTNHSAMSAARNDVHLPMPKVNRRSELQIEAKSRSPSAQSRTSSHKSLVPNTASLIKADASTKSLERSASVSTKRTSSTESVTPRAASIKSATSAASASNRSRSERAQSSQSKSSTRSARSNRSHTSVAKSNVSKTSAPSVSHRSRSSSKSSSESSSAASASRATTPSAKSERVEPNVIEDGAQIRTSVASPAASNESSKSSASSRSSSRSNSSSSSRKSSNSNSGSNRSRSGSPSSSASSSSAASQSSNPRDSGVPNNVDGANEVRSNRGSSFDKSSSSSSAKSRSSAKASSSAKSNAQESSAKSIQRDVPVREEGSRTPEEVAEVARFAKGLAKSTTNKPSNTRKWVDQISENREKREQSCDSLEDYLSDIPSATTTPAGSIKPSTKKVNPQPQPQKAHSSSSDSSASEDDDDESDPENFMSKKQDHLAPSMRRQMEKWALRDTVEQHFR